MILKYSQGVEKDALMDMLRWMENIMISGRLIQDLSEASSRISKLVGAIKSHVHMDRSDAAEPTNIHNDIENTLTLMAISFAKRILMSQEIYVPTCTWLMPYVGELNQVWTNLIDNAIDALEKNGELTIETSSGKKDVTVRIIDNGSGIPKEIQSRIFDPFFTTKKVRTGNRNRLGYCKEDR